MQWSTKHLLPLLTVIYILTGLLENGTKLETQVYRKPTNTGLLMHFQSHTDKHHKDSLLKTTIHRAYVLSSTTEAFNAESARLRSIFSRLDYPMSLIDSAINNFLFQNSSSNKAERNNEDTGTVRISKWPLMRFGSSYAILAIRLVLLCSHFSWARSWGNILDSKKSSHQL